jgi:hypothetical protein
MTRHTDRQRDPFARARARGNVDRELVDRQQLLEQRRQLHFAVAAAGLHVRQHALEIAHACRQRLHFPETAMHLLQTIGHHLERLAEPGLERALQFFLHRGAHLIQLGLVALLERAQLPLQCRADLAQVQCDGTCQVGELLLHARREVLQLLSAFFAVRSRSRFGEFRHARHLLAEPLQLLSLHAAQSGDLLHQPGLQLAQACARFQFQRAGRRLDGTTQFAF